MNLLTLDEARAAIARSGLRLLERCDSANPLTITAMLRGINSKYLNAHDRNLTRRHRRIINHVTALGYADIVDDELDGITSAAGLDNNTPATTRRRAS